MAITISSSADVTSACDAIKAYVNGYPAPVPVAPTPIAFGPVQLKSIAGSPTAFGGYVLPPFVMTLKDTSGNVIKINLATMPPAAEDVIGGIYSGSYTPGSPYDTLNSFVAYSF